MMTKLPRWVELGAFFLAMLAGSVNAVGLLGFQHESVSHLSGTATLLGLSLMNSDGMAMHLIGILLSFVAGSVLSGALVGNVALRLGRNYGVALVVEGGLLIAAMVALMNGSLSGHYLASAACGLQNALVSSYSGALVRTTHLTGLFTDIGILIGLKLRGKAFDRRRVGLYCLIIAGFIGGGSVGAVLFERVAFLALMLPIGMAFALALTYVVYAGKERSLKG